MSCNDSISIFKPIKLTQLSYGVTPKRLTKKKKVAFLKRRVL